MAIFIEITAIRQEHFVRRVQKINYIYIIFFTRILAETAIIFIRRVLPLKPYTGRFKIVEDDRYYSLVIRLLDN